MNVTELVAESNRIEGIHRAPTDAEVAEHIRFTKLGIVTVEELERFVSVYQPKARLRDRPGLDVRVGTHVPIAGGPIIRTTLANILESCGKKLHDPFNAHLHYETLHPFTDGNGRSGRALWYWLMARQGDFSRLQAERLGFLHTWYYQSLQHWEKDEDEVACLSR